VINSRKKILVIGMADSVHVARWLRQFAEQPIDFTLFPSSPHRRIHLGIKQLLRGETGQMSVVVKPASMKWLAFVLSALDLLFANVFRSRLLRQVIENETFDLIHVLELQHAGYLLVDTKLAPNLPKVLITNWGSDVYWFQQFPKHKQKIIELLKIASAYSAECQRDLEIVRSLGYLGVVMPVIPNSGGVDVSGLPKHISPPSQRKKIVIKGYTGFVGRALTTLRALEHVADHLDGYEVVIYSASLRVRLRALVLRLKHRVTVRIIKKRTPHSAMLRHFSESRIYIGISLSDGISTSLLEAMATGCYPIQTGTSCACEWLTATSGAIVSPSDIQEIGQRIREAITNDTLVDEAAKTNMAIIQSRASTQVVSPVALGFYQDLLSQTIIPDACIN
jgi:glycosyltransferase involved in cell wall biosynthesis